MIGPRPWRVRDDWRVLALGPDRHVSYCPTLPVLPLTTRSGGSWALIGLAVETRTERAAPDAALAEVTDAEIDARTRSWTGRWLLVGEQYIYTDAGALLPCFFRRAGTELWAGSSSALLALVPGTPVPTRVARTLGRGHGITWYPLPHSAREGIERLLPSQTLHADGSVGVRELLPGLDPTRDVADTLALVQERLVTPLRRLANAKTVWVPLTGGMDSRLVLAAAHGADRSVRAYTQLYPHIAMPDLLYPPRLAAAVGAPHIRIKAKRIDAARLLEYDAHTDGQINDADRSFYAARQWDFVSDCDVVLRGNCFEVARNGWRPFFADGGSEPPDVMTIIRQRGGEPSADAVDALSRWREWVIAHPVAGVDWRDRFYLEQRVSGWVASIEQSLDLVPGERFHVVNCAETFAALLSLPESMRVSGEHHLELIRMLAPMLADIPINETKGVTPRQRIVARLSVNPTEPLHRLTRSRKRH